MPRQNVLTLNAGSSSIKFALFSCSTAAQVEGILEGVIERVGESPFVRIKSSEGADLHHEVLPEGSTHEFCTTWLLGWLAVRNLRYDAVAHRVVHGGTRHTVPVRIDAQVLDSLEQLVALAPLHQPHNLAGIRAILKASPDIAQVACFDTAFHAAQPVAARRYALPLDFADRGVLAYGFHGLSYDYVSRHALVKERVRNVVLHLGSGSSACAMRNGESVASSMGFTALDGLVMGTRCGTLDPGVVLHLLREGRSLSEVEDVLYLKSGLKGLCGYADMRDVVRAMDAGAQVAAEAFVHFVQAAADHVTRLAGRMQGLDQLVFTAGIGENQPLVRQAICERLSWLGVSLDEEANNRTFEGVLSRQGSPVRVVVVPTNEERMLALHALDLLAPPTRCMKGVRVRCSQCVD